MRLLRAHLYGGNDTMGTQVTTLLTICHYYANVISIRKK